MKYHQESLELHKKLKGKIEMVSRVEVNSSEDLARIYSPGVSAPCLEIYKDKTLSYVYTRRHNTIAVITDGSAVLGLGNIGPEASMPVMEGKAVLFKLLGDIDAIPLSLNTQNTDEIVNIVLALSSNFAGINLEDISAPRCFEIERRLKQQCDIPIFHDDQHGTAIVVLAGVINALKLVSKPIDGIKVVINGIGAAGTAIAELLIANGVNNLVLVDKKGILCRTDDSLSVEHKALADKTNSELHTGSLSHAIQNADLFIGVSGPNCLSKEDVKKMNNHPIIFALANPTPEIAYEDAKSAGAYIVGTGLSNYPNQINNLLAFPGVFRGAINASAYEINLEMMTAASKAISDFIPEQKLNVDYIIPNPLDRNLHKAVSEAVKNAAIDTKVIKLPRG